MDVNAKYLHGSAGTPAAAHGRQYPCRLLAIPALVDAHDHDILDLKPCAD
jgi:hypothetical protein